MTKKELKRIGFRAFDICDCTGLPYQRLDSWDRKGFFSPSIMNNRGSGRSRCYSHRDLFIAKVLSYFWHLGLDISISRDVVPFMIIQPIESMKDSYLYMSPEEIDTCSLEGLTPLLEESSVIIIVSLAAVLQDIEQLFPGFTQELIDIDQTIFELEQLQQFDSREEKMRWWNEHKGEYE